MGSGRGGPRLTMIKMTETAQQRGTRLRAVNSNKDEGEDEDDEEEGEAEDEDEERLPLRRRCLLPSGLEFFI